MFIKCLIFIKFVDFVVLSSLKFPYILQGSV